MFARLIAEMCVYTGEETLLVRRSENDRVMALIGEEYKQDWLLFGK